MIKHENDIAKLLVQLTEFYPEFTLSDVVLKFYIAHLKHLDFNKLRRATHEWAFSHTRFPTVAELLGIASK